MSTRNIEVSASSDIELLTKISAINEVLKLSTKQLKNLAILAKSDKAKEKLADDIQFAFLRKFL